MVKMLQDFDSSFATLDLTPRRLKNELDRAVPTRQSCLCIPCRHSLSFIALKNCKQKHGDEDDKGKAMRTIQLDYDSFLMHLIRLSTECQA